RARCGRRGAPAGPAPTPGGRAAAPQSARTACLRRTRSYVHLPTRLGSEAISSLELLTELHQTAGNPTRDCAGGELELLSDRPVRRLAGRERGQRLPVA